MKKPVAQNVLRVVDLYQTQVSVKLKNFFRIELDETYRDQKLNEHIYNISDVFENDEIFVPAELKEEIELLQELLNDHDAGYLRIIY